MFILFDRHRPLTNFYYTFEISHCLHRLSSFQAHGFWTSTSNGSSCPYPFKLILLRVSKMDSIAFLFGAEISSAVAAEIVLAILVILLLSCLAKQMVSVSPFLLQ